MTSFPRQDSSGVVLYLLIMPGHSLNPKIRRTLWLALGFFCVALIVFGGIVRVAHTHASGPAVHDDCALCLTAHLSVRPAVSAPNMTPSFARVAYVRNPKPLHGKYRLVVFSLYNRPPPNQPAVA